MCIKNIYIIVCFCVALCPIWAEQESQGIIDLENELARLTDEISQRQQKITQLILESDLKGNESLYKYLFRESPKDIRETLVYVIMRKISEEDLKIKENDELHDLFNYIVNPKKHAKDYKLHLAEIFYSLDIPEFNTKDQSLRNDMPLSASLSEESKSFYVSYSSSLLRFLYLSRWLED